MLFFGNYGTDIIVGTTFKGKFIIWMYPHSIPGIILNHQDFEISAINMILVSDHSHIQVYTSNNITSADEIFTNNNLSSNLPNYLPVNYTSNFKVSFSYKSDSVIITEFFLPIQFRKEENLSTMHFRIQVQVV